MIKRQAPSLEFREVEDKEGLYQIVEDDGNVIDQFGNWANSDFPEDLTIHRDIGEIYQRAYAAGYARAKRER